MVSKEGFEIGCIEVKPFNAHTDKVEVDRIRIAGPCKKRLHRRINTAKSREGLHHFGVLFHIFSFISKNKILFKPLLNPYILNVILLLYEKINVVNRFLGSNQLFLSSLLPISIPVCNHTLMSLPSVTQRQELLDLLEDVLRYPEKYGDHFFRDGVKNSKDGMVLISFLHSLALEVGNFPIKYIQYCAPLDIKTRFRLSQDEKEIGLFDHPYNEETDRYGFIKQLDDEEQGTKDAFDSLSNEESNKGSTSNATESGNVKIKKSGSKMAYTPSIFSQLLETGSVQPTIYSDGKFYIDNEHYEQHDSIEGASKFEYDIPNIEPLGISAPM